MATRLQRQEQIPQPWRRATVLTVIVSATAASVFYFLDQADISRAIWLGSSALVAAVAFYFVYFKSMRW